MPYGGYGPIRRFGSSRGGLLEALTKSLLMQRGPAFDQESTQTIVWVECHAHARAIWEAYETAQRAANAFDPEKCPASMLSRWERIFRIYPSPSATLAERRAALVAAWQRIGSGLTGGVLAALVTSLASELAPTVTHLTSATATTHTYTAVTVPGGITTTSDGRWGSSLHSATIVCTPVSSESDGQTLTRLEALRSQLARWFAGWMTYYVGVPTPTGGGNEFRASERNCDFSMVS